MQNCMKLALLASATLASATNHVTYVSMDNITRTIVWTGDSHIENTEVPAGQNVTVELPYGWTGNSYSVSSGNDLGVPGMLAEFAWNSYADATYFDVSAIVEPNDQEGVYQMYPVDTQEPVSGCWSFACSNAYYLPDDIQTKSTTSNHIVVTLGAGGIQDSEATSKREVENFPHDAVVKRDWTPSLKARFTSSLRWANRLRN